MTRKEYIKTLTEQARALLHAEIELQRQRRKLEQQLEQLQDAEALERAKGGNNDN